jgi:uncharacterized protein (TIGR00725 family)
VRRDRAARRRSLSPVAPHPYIAVIGPGRATEQQVRDAERVGSGLARAGAILVCGGLGGVMAAACRGAKAAGGTTVGILPGSDRSQANEWVDIAVPTGLGEARNALVVRAGDAIVAVGGEYGTLSEIALALKAGKTVVGIGTWTLGREPDPIVRAEDADAGVALALAAVR